ncbi:MAG: alpha/beta hydrolase [bacterium]|nr:alpha/beta hydrolase [bacterium]
MKECFYSQIGIYPHTLQKVAREGVGIYYRINDFLPDRKTLVFVHGLTGSSSAWLKYEQKFQNEYNILSFDLRGHGKSVRPKRYEAYAIKNFAEDLHELVNYLRLEKFILISHSFGTLIALEFLCAYQSMVTSAVFLGVNYGVARLKFAPVTRLFLKWSSAFVSFWPFSVKVGGHIDYSRYPDTPDVSVRRISTDVRNTGVRVYLYCLRHIFGFDHDDWWSRIEIPVLIMHGRQDTYIPAVNAIALAKQMKNSELMIFENANHILILNNFAEVSAAIKDFVEK